MEAHEEDPGPLPWLRGMQKAARAESGGPAQGRNCSQDPSSTKDACLQSGGGFHPDSTPNKLRQREEQARQPRVLLVAVWGSTNVEIDHQSGEGVPRKVGTQNSRQ